MSWFVARKGGFACVSTILLVFTSCTNEPRAANNAPDGGAGDDAGSIATDGAMTVDAGPTNMDCGAVIACEAACSTRECRTECESRGSPTGASLAHALDTCLETVCARAAGDVCDSPDSTCRMCEGQALTHGCSVLYGACIRNSTSIDGGSSNADGGTETIDGGAGPLDGGSVNTDGGTSNADGGSVVPTGVGSCFDISLCSNGCGTIACTQECVSVGTSEAQEGFNALIDCIYTECPKTSGAICDYNSPTYDQNACYSCLGTAQSAGHACFALAVGCAGTVCTRSSNCTSLPASPYCDDSIGYCVQCRSASDCGAGGACIDYVCQRADLTCVDVYSCLYGCVGANCQDNCIEGGTSSARTLYQGYSNCLEAVCTSNGNGPCSDRNSESCTDCTQRAQNGVCYAQILACIAKCNSSIDCRTTPATPACDTVTSTCVQCTRSSECDPGAICASHVCIRTCDSTTDCPRDQTCTDGICVAR